MMLYHHTMRGLILSDLIISKISHLNQALLLRPAPLHGNDRSHLALSSENTTMFQTRLNDRVPHIVSTINDHRDGFFNDFDIHYALIMVKDIQETISSFDPTLGSDMRVHTMKANADIHELHINLAEYHESKNTLNEEEAAYVFEHKAIDVQHDLSELVKALHQYDPLMFPHEVSTIQSDQDGQCIQALLRYNNITTPAVTDPNQPGMTLWWHAPDFTWSCLVRYDHYNRFPETFSISLRDMLIQERISTLHLTPYEAMDFRRVLLNATGAYKGQIWGEGHNLHKADLEHGGTRMTFRNNLSELTLSPPPDHRQVFSLSYTGKETAEDDDNTREGTVIDLSISHISSLRNLIRVLVYTHPEYNPTQLDYGKQYMI